MTLALRYAVRSDVGLLREGNEDSAYAGPSLLAVADGMGGHAAGEVASAVTIGAISELDRGRPGTGSTGPSTIPPSSGAGTGPSGTGPSTIPPGASLAGDMMSALSAAVASANMRLQQMIIANPAVEGMGTTLTAVLWSDGHAAVCHIGDSRGYLLRGGELYQITHDHTLVQSLVDEGRITEDDVSTHPQRSLLLRALDGRTVAEPDLSAHESLPGDRYLLCSDGLSGVVSDETLREMLATIPDPEAATRQLIDLAIRGGGPDNITCIVADVVDTNVTRGPLPTKPILAGAAVNGTSPLPPPPGTNPFAAVSTGPRPKTGRGSTAPQPVLDDNSNLTRAHGIPVPQNGYQDGYGEAFSENSAGTATEENSFGESGFGSGGARKGHRRTRARRRRWPIVTVTLGVLVAILVAGGYFAYQNTQGQYYVTLDGGQVVIYQGINYKFLGIALAHPFQHTAVQEAQLPSDIKQELGTNPTAANLTSAQNIVTNAKAGVTKCQQAYQALATWQTQTNAYNAYKKALQEAVKNHTGKPSVVQKPGNEPMMPPGTCPPSTAYGIAQSALPVMP
jgi:PPM family protein phosphatase